MDFTNRNSGWTDRFLRRMLAWVCRNRHIGIRLRDIHRTTFRGCKNSFSGTAWGWNREIVVGIGSSEYYPMSAQGRLPSGLKDRMEALISVTAHELMHVAQYVSDEHKCSSKGRGKETQADHVAELVLVDFRRQRDDLMADWAREPAERPSVVKLSVVQRRAENARRKLAEWEKKQRTAKRKVNQWAGKVAYYSLRGTYDDIAVLRDGSFTRERAATSPRQGK